MQLVPLNLLRNCTSARPRLPFNSGSSPAEIGLCVARSRASSTHFKEVVQQQLTSIQTVDKAYIRGLHNLAHPAISSGSGATRVSLMSRLLGEVPHSRFDHSTLDFRVQGAVQQCARARIHSRVPLHIRRAGEDEGTQGRS